MNYLLPKSENARNYRHGHKPADGISPEYLSWRGMRARCNNKKNPNYRKYGERGIKVCDRWQNSFINFLNDMGMRPSRLHSIERIDNDGNYELSNCRWATPTEQANNRRSNRFLEFDGQRLTLAQWSARSGIEITTLHQRISSGWTIERAITTPTRKVTRRPRVAL